MLTDTYCLCLKNLARNTKLLSPFCPVGLIKGLVSMSEARVPLSWTWSGSLSSSRVRHQMSTLRGRLEPYGAKMAPGTSSTLKLP